MTEKSVTMTDGDIIAIKEVIQILYALHLLGLDGGEDKWNAHRVALTMLVTRYEEADAV